tara:strand:- start:5497 stop:5613 length:117 start_codon:yes stop_codon:yes gene_type:complete
MKINKLRLEIKEATQENIIDISKLSIMASGGMDEFFFW